MILLSEDLGLQTMQRLTTNADLEQIRAFNWSTMKNQTFTNATNHSNADLEPQEMQQASQMQIWCDTDNWK